jgi:hypothetical protein
VAVAEKLAWSRSTAKENDDLLASDGFDKKLLEKIKNESASCACAFCGMIIFGDSKVRHARDVAGVFSSTTRWPRFSSRGVAASNFIAPVIQDLVSENGQLFSCETCEGIFQACAKAREDKELVAIPPRFSLDFGSRVGLPELTLVEKAAVAINRMYGKVVKIKHNMGAGTPSNLCGHLINFRHSGPDSVSKVLPNTDVDQLIVVHFIGGNQKWERMMPLLEGGRDHLLALRPDVVFLWLNRLKETHPDYKGVVLLDNDGACRLAMEESFKRMLQKTMVKDDGDGAAAAEEETDQAAESNIAQDLPQAGFSDVVLEEQDPVATERSKRQRARSMLNIASSGAPENEFDDNEGLLARTFPWVFMFGKVGMPPNSGVNMELRRRLLLQYDRRFEREPALIFLLFNQMQRHRAAQNIVTAPPGTIDDINALAALPNIEDVLAEAFSEHPSDAGKETRKLIMRGLQIGESSVPFARTEMDRAFTTMIGMMRWFGCPLIFLTITPLAIDSAFALKLCAFGETIDIRSYDERSKAVLQSPAMSSVYFQKMIGFILEEVVCIPETSAKKTKADDATACVGIFGQCVAEAHTVEVQGRTALHAHMLIWSKISPEYIQQCWHTDMVDKMEQIRKFMEHILVVKMPPEFWEVSDAIWNDKTPGRIHAKLDPPGLNAALPEDLRLYHNVNNNQLHRQHKPTCFKKGPGTGKLSKNQFDKKNRCRMAMPAGLWEFPTDMVAICYDEDVKKVEPVRGVSPQSVKCTHVFRCDCKSILDVGNDNFFPLIMEMNRPTEKDAIVAGFTPEILEITGANSSTTVISSILQGGPIMLYLIKYNTKAKTTIANAFASASAAFEKFQQTENRTEKTIFNQIVNAFSSGQEVPATMAAYALLGGHGFSCTVGTWYVFPHDAMTKSLTDEVRQLGALEHPELDEYGMPTDVAGDGESIGENAELEEIQLRENDIYNEAPFADCNVNGRVYIVGGNERVVLKQHELYINRPDKLEDCCFLSFCIMFDVVPVAEEKEKNKRTESGKQNGRKPQPRYKFKSGFVLCNYFELVLRAKYPMPILAGGTPPSCSLSRRSRVASGGRAVWAFYWAAMVIPWRNISQAARCTFGIFTETWFMPALLGELGETKRDMALFINTTTFSMKADGRANLAMNIWRFRNAGTEKDWKMERQIRGERVGRDDEEVEADNGAMGDESRKVLMLLAMGEEQKHDMRIEEIFARDDEEQAPCDDARPRHRNTSAVWCDDAETSSLIKDVISFEPAQRPDTRKQASVSNNQSGDGFFQECDVRNVPPPPGLNEDQAAVFSRVLSSIASGKQELLFVQGEAGTGKSFVIRHIAEAAATIAGPNSVRCLSPTGVASENLLPGSFTIHRGLSINIMNVNKEMGSKERNDFTERYSGTVVFIIDEISMVQPALLCIVDRRLRCLAESAKPWHARTYGLDPSRPFGGHTVVAMGDFFQIPPVTGNSILKDSLEPGRQGPVSASLWGLFSLIVLEKQMRARDPEQEARIKILRGGAVTQELLDSICELKSGEAESWAEAVYIVLTNKERHKFNESLAVAFAKKRGLPIVKWRKEIGGGKTKKYTPEEIDMIYKIAPQLTSTFVLGAPAMVTQNVNPALGLSNGSDATLTGIVCSNDRDTGRVNGAGPGEVVWLTSPPKYVYVSVGALNAADDRLCFPIVNGELSVPLALRKEEEEIRLDKNITIITQSHCVDLAFSVTVYKVQGKTLPKAVVCLGMDSDRRAYSFEMFLVAVTRVRFACDLRMFPGASSRKKESLLRLRPNDYTTQWFDKRMFDASGRRGYTDARGSAAPQKKQRLPATPSKMTLKKEEQCSPERKQIRLEPPMPPYQPEPPQVEMFLLDVFGAHYAGDDVPNDPASLQWIDEIKNRGNFISESVVVLVPTILKGFFSPLEAFIGRLEMRRISDNRRAWNEFAPDPQFSYSSFIWYRGHFVAVRADKGLQKLLVYESKTTHSNHHAREKQRHLKWPVAFCKKLWDKNEVEVIEVPVRQQVENECAIETINNILAAAAPAALFSFTRESLCLCFLRLLHTH